jgi:hypothetical protein
MKDLPSPSRGRNKGLMIAGNLTPDDRQILNDHAKMLYKTGTPSAIRELKQMNIRYREYGWGYKVPGA